MMYLLFGVFANPVLALDLEGVHDVLLIDFASIRQSYVSCVGHAVKNLHHLHQIYFRQEHIKQ